MPTVAVMLRAVLTPAEEDEIRRLAHEKDERLTRLHDRLVDLYEAHRSDDDPVTMKYLADLAGYTESRVSKLVSERRGTA